MINLKLLGIITDSFQEKKINKILNSNNIANKYSTIGYGCASPGTLAFFGLDAVEKSVILALIPDYLENALSEKLLKSLKLEGLGNGLGFVIPLSSANSYLSDTYQNVHKEVHTVKREENEIKYELIVTIVLEGYIEKVMKAASKAGATGGTAIYGKGLGGKTSQKLFGFTIEPGRDIVINVVPKEIKKEVMTSISKHVGIKTSGMGLCFSLPIDSIIGYESK